MKTFITILLMAFAANLAVSQEGHREEGEIPGEGTQVANSFITNIESYYYKQRKAKPLSFQVSPQVIYQNGNVLYGSGIGVNYNEMVSIAYFHSRDYDFSDVFMDNRWAGIYMAFTLPVHDAIDLGPVVRFSTFNTEWQKVYVGAELRVDIGWNTKLGVEYGKGNEEAVSLKLIWNIY
jgi:hypothetical protein